RGFGTSSIAILSLPLKTTAFMVVMIHPAPLPARALPCAPFPGSQVPHNMHVRGARIGAVETTDDKAVGDESVHHAAAGVAVDAPHAPNLRARQHQSGHFLVFSSDETNRFGVGSFGDRHFSFRT